LECLCVNGGNCDSGVGGTGSCKCPPGHTGDNCEFGPTSQEVDITDGGHGLRAAKFQFVTPEETPFIADLATSKPSVASTLSPDGNTLSVTATFNDAHAYPNGRLSPSSTATAPACEFVFRTSADGGFDLFSTTFTFKNASYGLAPASDDQLHSCVQSVPFSCSSVVLTDNTGSSLTMTNMIVNAFGSPSIFTASGNECKANFGCGAKPSKSSKTGTSTGAVVGIAIGVAVVVGAIAFFVSSKRSRGGFSALSESTAPSSSNTKSKRGGQNSGRVYDDD